QAEDGIRGRNVTGVQTCALPISEAMTSGMSGESGVAGLGDSAARPLTDVDFVAVPAEPERLPELRRALAEWAERVGMSAEQVEAVTLAGYEALANAATHAYAAGTGTLNLHAEYRSARRQVQVAVSDAGRWRTPPTDRDGLGGRGLVLIRSLAEHAEVHTDASGTTVSMHWTVPEAGRDA